MPIQIHPEQGTIVICDFKGFVPPEMVKRRPAVVISPRLRRRQHLCTVVPLSTTPPNPVAAYHHKFTLDPVLPKPYNSKIQWVKADMLYTVSFDRLYLPFEKKDGSGKRTYDIRVLDKADMIKIQQCILHGIGLTSLTDYL
ncbi:type II toxin-antitoxin system PemK/MazF family toxin [Thiolapillus sp.]|uniref:type II toxin-antitoxin system PemK/MazF family toxin n=1 Tax=Thiolapillus sp. TaxID=2017437 RepID=UPI003AF8CC02